MMKTQLDLSIIYLNEFRILWPFFALSKLLKWALMGFILPTMEAQYL